MKELSLPVRIQIARRRRIQAASEEDMMVNTPVSRRKLPTEGFGSNAERMRWISFLFGVGLSISYVLSDVGISACR